MLKVKINLSFGAGAGEKLLGADPKEDGSQTAAVWKQEEVLANIELPAPDSWPADEGVLLLPAEAGGGAEGAYFPGLSLWGGGSPATPLWL